MKQIDWRPFGWRILFTYGQGFGFGIWTGWGWVQMRVNGFDLMLGPVTLTIQPPTPKWLDEVVSENEPEKTRI